MTIHFFDIFCAAVAKVSCKHGVWLVVRVNNKKPVIIMITGFTGDERIELPPKVLETPIIPFDQSPTLDIPSKPHTLNTYTSYHTFFPNTTIFCKTFVLHFRSSPRPISNSQLHALRHFHLCPIYLVVFKGSYFFRMGYLILRGASRLDAFSVYPFPTWLPGREPGGSTGTPEVSPSRSSRTKDSSSQISYAHAG